MSVDWRNHVDNYGSAERPLQFKKPPGRCCKINYRVRYFYSKGAFLVILWSTLVSASMAQFGNGLNSMHSFIASSIYLTFAFILIFICMPLIGWLADAKFGNFKVFKAEIVLVFVAATVGQIGMETISEFQSIPKGIKEAYKTLYKLSGIIGTVTCLVTSLQLGLDQMPDASSDNTASFIARGLFSFSTGLWLGDKLPSTIQNCVNDDLALEISITFLSPICMTVACCTVFIMAPRYLVVEPKAPKSLKTIYQVLKFAAKHKSPLNRSALTYWEEDIPSRLDLAKSRYGGPFTTEQVEDVKTFFKLLIMLIPISLMSFAVPIICRNTKPPLQKYSHCLTELVQTFTSDRSWSWMIAILLYELVLFPLARYKLPNTLKRIGIALFLFFLIKCIFTVETVAASLSSNHSTNSTGLHTGLLFEIETWANVILSFFHDSVLFLAMNWLLGFVCAQTPYNMRGLLTGSIVFVVVSSIFLGNEMVYLVQRLVEYEQASDIISLSVATGIGLVGFILYCVLARWYKMRVRDENYSPHRVVEEIYSRYLSHVQ